MDELARFNQQRWGALADARILYSRPWLELDADSARERLDDQGLLGDVAGLDVLCLAGGGGQQSAAFGLLAANVTVVDLTQTQLDRDQEAARHYGLTTCTVQGDMRDLSGFEADSFDLVWHAHSMNFVPDSGEVFDQVVHVLRPGGRYRLHWGNPYYHGLAPEYWDGNGYSLRLPYVDGAEVTYDTPTRVLSNRLVRYFNNNSGGDIAVNEVALVNSMQQPGAWPRFVMSRDKLDTTVTVPDTGQLKVTYTIQLTYPV